MPRQISQNFTLAELTVTNSGAENTPDSQQIANLTALCAHILEPIRAHFGKPVVVTSGFRSAAVNARLVEPPHPSIFMAKPRISIFQASTTLICGDS